ncbi:MULTISPECIES: hypothetical protein [unclassified Microbacterium]|uniref:hypothetical protein n=1 Tax=unclassified Microbacterium TaxID=2609290 RepID=UPI000CFD197E|nr:MULTISPECIES: hypothetical protein [unclassified Microbacterium]PQZ55341.1 hypothetical protein CQ032_11585 [Microbacterium sp. MYb43]PQZ73958.1 hypothetical protein CQ031_16555 [Microbacterium sp. MYb40]PRB21121.1 hypothetical protein CQ040_09915 [Microbacterium sp. MYb54]PRB26303.1 hypothetical protein CQ037_13350 [Microbacterium sp. MYb50]PRB66942.1 hypothetical protein CQ021_09605 [Microbacterium sp. MYb24]
MTQENELPIDPADPEYELKVAEWFQSVTDGPKPGDDEPVRITVRQAQKIAAIMGAVSRGHEGYVNALRDASWFLDCVVAEGIPGERVPTSMSVAEAWQRVETYPWPRPGKPREQQI